MAHAYLKTLANTKPQRFLRGCTGKVQYDDRFQARVAAAETRGKNRNRGEVEEADVLLRPYRCPACHFWHIGHETVSDGKSVASVNWNDACITVPGIALALDTCRADGFQPATIEIHVLNLGELKEQAKRDTSRPSPIHFDGGAVTTILGVPIIFGRVLSVITVRSADGRPRIRIENIRARQTRQP